MGAGTDLVQQLTDALKLTKQYIERLQNANALLGPDAPGESHIQKLESAVIRPVGAGEHPVTKLADDYLKQTGCWFSNEKDLLQQAGKHHLRAVELGLWTEQEAMPTLHALKDAWEMIRWYRTLIPIKIQSALRIMTTPPADKQLATYHLGKAKLVLVSIDRSLLAWQIMMQHYPDKTDDLLDLLALLSRLRGEVETLFPGARGFQRPGLD